MNARIKKVWIGVEDPDPTVDRKGIKFLLDHGIEVEMFDSDLQVAIREANKQFIEEAEIRAKKVAVKKEPLLLSAKEKVEPTANIGDLNSTEIAHFINEAEMDFEYGSDEFLRVFQQLNLLEQNNNEVHPTGLGILLFGKNPQRLYQNAVIRATYKTGTKGEQIETFAGPLINQTENAMKWFERIIGHQIDRNNAKRETILDYPSEVIREALTNAVVHRDYDIGGAPIYFEVSDDAIVIKSPGEPVPPLKREQIQNFTAPSLSRNPKIMYVFDQLDLVEQRGFGFISIKGLPQQYDLPLPIVSFDAPYMVMTFPRTIEAVRTLSDKEGIEKLTPEELQGYEWMRTQESVAAKDYAEHMNHSSRTASRHLANFVALGLATTNGENIKSKNLRYLVIR
ncbi:MAG: ATP-binding protein [Flavobacterium sp.]